MTALTLPQLRTIYPTTPETTCKLYLEPLNRALIRANCDTVNRKAAFLGQLGVESAGLTTMSENLNYRSPERLDAMFSAVKGTADAARLIAKGAFAIANRVYANRLGNGDEASGDGWRYRGAGGIQCTGKANHAAFGKTIDMVTEVVPAYLRTADGAMAVTAWYWTKNNLNASADHWAIDTITRIVNGPAMAGAVERRTISDRARKVLSQ